MVRLTKIHPDTHVEVCEYPDNTYDTLLELLEEHYPDGFKLQTEVYVDNKMLPKFAEYDCVKLADVSRVTIIQFPAGGIGLFIGKFILSTLFSMAVGALFAPKKPKRKSELKKSDEVYSLTDNQNRIRLGENIPLVFGSVRLYPSLLSPPHYYYINNEEYVTMLMCVGYNQMNVSEVLVNDTTVDNLQTGNFEYKVLYKDQYEHLSTVDDSGEWVELIKEIPDIDMLQLKALPENTKFTCKLGGEYMYIFPYPNGTLPNISDLGAGSKMKVVDSTMGNNGEYTVDTIDYYDDSHTNERAIRVKFTDSSFVNEPDDTQYDITDTSSNLLVVKDDYISIYSDEDGWQNTNAKEMEIIELVGTDNNDTNWLHIKKDDGGKDYILNDELLTDETISADNIKYIKRLVPLTVEANFWYGGYTLKGQTINNEALQGIEVDVTFPQGLFYLDDNNDYQETTVDFKVQICKNGTDCVEFDSSVTSSRSSEARFTFFYPIDSVDVNATYTIALRKVTPDSDNLQLQSDMYIKRIKGLYGFEDTSKWHSDSEEGLTLLWVRVKASNALSSQSQFSVNCWVDGKFNNLADVVRDIYSNDVYGAKLDSTDLIIDPSANDKLVNGAFTNKRTIMDSIQNLCDSNGYISYVMGKNLIVKQDKMQNFTVAFFNESNIIAGTYEKQYKFINNDIDGVKVSYMDAELGWKEQEYTYPENATNAEAVDLFGVTGLPAARDMATLFYNRKRYRRKTIKFDTDIQGYVPQYLDKIAVSRSVQNGSYPTVVISRVDDTHIRVREIDSNVSIDDTVKVYFRHIDDGSLVGGLDATVRANNVLEFDRPLDSWIDGYKDKEGVFLSYSKLNDVVEYLQITKITPKSEDVVTIECVNYDENVWGGNACSEPQVIECDENVKCCNPVSCE